MCMIIWYGSGVHQCTDGSIIVQLSISIMDCSICNGCKQGMD